MRKKRVILLVATLLILIIPLTAFAEDPDPAVSESPETAPAPTHAQSPAFTPAATQPSSPTANPTAEPTPLVDQLIIDSRNLYEGMDRTYAQGYVPRIVNGRAYIILPLLGETYDGKVTVTADLNAMTWKYE